MSLGDSFVQSQMADLYQLLEPPVSSTAPIGDPAGQQDLDISQLEEFLNSLS
jgi:hypothetical protein